MSEEIERAEEWAEETTRRTNLTERQAIAYVLAANGVGREEIAERLGTGASNVDNARREAAQKIRRASALTQLVEQMPVPDGARRDDARD